MDKAEIPGLINTLLQTCVAVGALCVIALQHFLALDARRRREAPAGWSVIPVRERLELQGLRISIWMGIVAVLVLVVGPLFLVVLYFIGRLSPKHAATGLLEANVLGVVLLTLAVLRVRLENALRPADLL